jgi:hypothetical protein
MLSALALAVVLHMSNVARVPQPTVDRAQEEVVRLYRRIGVAVEWIRFDPGSSALPSTIRVVLTTRAHGELERREKPVMGAALWTPQGVGVTYVFYRQLEAQAGQYAVSESLVLACAIAHEIGHLLLRDRPHSVLGLMRASWDREDFQRAGRGQLRFSPEEADLIRARRLHP